MIVGLKVGFSVIFHTFRRRYIARFSGDNDKFFARFPIAKHVFGMSFITLTLLKRTSSSACFLLFYFAAVYLMLQK